MDVQWYKKEFLEDQHVLHNNLNQRKKRPRVHIFRTTVTTLQGGSSHPLLRFYLIANNLLKNLKLLFNVFLSNKQKSIHFEMSNVRITKLNESYERYCNECE